VQLHVERLEKIYNTYTIADPVGCSRALEEEEERRRQRAKRRRGRRRRQEEEEMRKRAKEMR
jgi:hypothetical protein